MAGVLGFEPRLNDPESLVLPLHYTPMPHKIEEPLPNMVVPPYGNVIELRVFH